MLRIPHCQDNRLTDGGKSVSLKHRLPVYSPKRLFISVSGIHFYSKLSKPQGLVRPEGLGKLINLNDLIGPPTCNLPACSIVNEPIYWFLYSLHTDGVGNSDGSASNDIKMMKCKGLRWKRSYPRFDVRVKPRRTSARVVGNRLYSYNTLTCNVTINGADLVTVYAEGRGFGTRQGKSMLSNY
jgi:hypothetical protein